MAALTPAPAAPPRVSMQHRFLSGALSGTVTAALLQPFDVLRTLQQASLSSTARPGLSATARQLVQQQGVGALWKGLQATLLRVFVGAGIYFVCLDVINRELSNPSIAAPLRGGRSSDTHTLHDGRGPASTSTFNDGASSRAERHPEPPLDGRPAAHAQVALPQHQPQSTSLASRGSLQSFIAGAAARSVAATVMNPVAVVKTRMEFAPLGASGYPSALHGVVSIARAEGVRGLYRGLAATILRDAPYSGLYFMAYSWSIRSMDQSIAATRARQHRTAGSNSGRSGGTNSSVESLAERAGTLLASSPASGRNFVAALFSGSLATIATQPADLLKTHQQLTGVLARTGATATAANAAAATANAASAAAASPAHAVKSATMAATIRTALASGGLRSLFLGGTARVLKRALSTAVTWTLFEEAMRRGGGGGGG